MRNIVINHFVEIFNRVPSDRVFIQSPSESVTYGDVSETIRQFGAEHPYLLRKNCALVCDTRFHLAKTIPVVASLANKIFLKPQGLNDVVEQGFYQTSGIEYVINVTDANLIVTQLAHVENSKPHEQEWLLSTSGTTGTPKLISYNLVSLMKTSQKNVNNGTRYKWGLCYDLNRFAGLQVYFQTIASGSSLAISEHQTSLNETINLFINSDVNCMSATPSFWRKVLMTKTSHLLALKRITLGGEISDQSVLNTLQNNFKNAHIIHIYASTEVGVGFSVKDGLAGFPLDYIGNSQLSPVLLKIVSGVLWIKSSRAASIIINGTLEIDDHGFINTGDIVEIKNDRVLFIGRESGTINVGGNKVIPEEIEAVLNSHPDVCQSRVFGKKNPVLGMLVNAHIVNNKIINNEEVKQFKKELILFCKGKLEPFKIPAMIKLVDVIVVNESGKIVRK